MRTQRSKQLKRKLCAERELAEAVGEEKFWNQFDTKNFLKGTAAITDITVSPNAPYEYTAVCSASNVFIYSNQRHEVIKVITKTNATETCGVSFRDDGRLLAIGGSDNSVDLYPADEAQDWRHLRTFKGHTNTIRVTQFSSNQTHLMSCSDDRTVRCWDVLTQQLCCTLRAHTDFVRAGAISKADHNIWFSAGYDQVIHMWDMRTEKVVSSFDHGAPIESLVVMPGGQSILSAGDNYFHMWDVVAGKILHTTTEHLKTITSLKLDGTSTRIFSGSLDHHVKIYDTKTLAPIWSSKETAPILCLAIPEDNSQILIGMSDATFCIRSRSQTVFDEESDRKRSNNKILTSGSIRYFIKSRDNVAREEITTVRTQMRKLRSYERSLSKFDPIGAINNALKNPDDPVTVISLLEEIDHRSMLNTALLQLDENSLVPLLQMLVRYILDFRFTSYLVNIASIILDGYGRVIGQSIIIDDLFVKLKERVLSLVDQTQQMILLQGTLDLLINSNNVGSKAEMLPTDNPFVPKQ